MKRQGGWRKTQRDDWTGVMVAVRHGNASRTCERTQNVV